MEYVLQTDQSTVSSMEDPMKSKAFIYIYVNQANGSSMNIRYNYCFIIKLTYNQF